MAIAAASSCRRESGRPDSSEEPAQQSQARKGASAEANRSLESKQIESNQPSYICRCLWPLVNSRQIKHNRILPRLMTLECDVCKAERLARRRVVGASDDPRFKQSTRTHTFFCLSQCLSCFLCVMLVVDICYRRPSTISPNITLRYAGHPSCRRRTCIRGTTTKRLPSCAPSNSRACLLSSVPS